MRPTMAADHPDTSIDPLHWVVPHRCPSPRASWRIATLALALTSCQDPALSRMNGSLSDSEQRGSSPRSLGRANEPATTAAANLPIRYELTADGISPTFAPSDVHLQ